MKKVLITGCQGYIGSRLSQYLEERNITCVGADTGYFNDAMLVDGFIDIPLIRHDVRDIVDSDLDGVDAVIHLAAISNDPLNQLDPATFYHPVREYTHYLAKLCKQRSVRFIFPSSCSVYGVGNNNVFLDENSALSPQTGYSWNKMHIEQDLEALASLEFSPVALRLSTVFGWSPRMRFDLVINMLVGMGVANRRLKLNSNGLAWRPFLHIDDACEAFYQAIFMKAEAKSGLTVLNVGRNDNNLRIIDLVRMIQSLDPSIVHDGMTEDDPASLAADRKIQDGVDKRTYKVKFDFITSCMEGYRAKYTAREGIQQLYDQLTALGLDEKTFYQRGFYRLQHLEDLFDQGYIDHQMRVITE